jgi:hypothetical protein
MAMANSKRLGVVAAILMLLVTLGAAIFVVKWYVWPSDTNGTSASSQTPSGDANAAANQIQVGVLLSEFTAIGPHRGASPYGYPIQLRAANALHDPSIHLIPVVEGNSARRNPLRKLLADEFPDSAPLDATKVSDLRKLNVLVATSAANVPDNVLRAIDESVHQGMGLLQRQLGYLTPGYNNHTLVNELCGYDVGTFGWNAKPVECEVVGNHPLLGDLAGQTGKTISLIPNGTVGTLKGIPLLRVKNMADISLVNVDHRVATGEYLYPLYISQLGQGRIVGVGFTQGQDVPADLDAAHNHRFYIHCVEWLAGKPLN